MNFENIFPEDCISKRERIELTLSHNSIDRVVILEQLSCNPAVISAYTGKSLIGFIHAVDDICELIQKTLDMTMPPIPPKGTEKLANRDGFIFQNDNWNSWHVSRPFTDEIGARDWYRDYMFSLQKKIGDTVILNYSQTGFCSILDSMGLEIFYYPYLTKLTEAWHEHDIKVLYHSDGNYKSALPQLIECGVDGFYCIEMNAGMDVVELKNHYPEYIWAGGVDGVELMEQSNRKMVTEEVCRHIIETDVLNKGGMIVTPSSEINPLVKAENFSAMANACNIIRNSDF